MSKDATPPRARIRFLAFLLLAFGVQSAAPASAQNAGGLNYPSYDIRAFCRDARAVRMTGHLYDCEDREQAVATLLNAHWETLKIQEPVLIEVCKANERYAARRPSYISLLQCITRVHDAAD